MVSVDVGCVERDREVAVVNVSQPPPNHPGRQLELVEVLVAEMTFEDEEEVGGSVVVVTVKFADSLQPNQPGVKQVVVV